MSPEQVALLTDARLSDAARVLGLHLSTLGEGDHEMRFDALAALLHGCPQAETVGRHMRQLVVFGYAEMVSRGGRGSPRYRWSTPKIIGAEGSMPRNKSGESPTVVVDADDVITPYSPPADLDDRTAAVVDRLTGCRGSVRDYLLACVPVGNRQYAYAQTVRSWLDGADPGVWRMANGSHLPPDERPPMLAAALNELAAGDEKDMKRPIGDPANLRTKLNINLRKRADHERSNGTNGGRAAGSGGSQTSDYDDFG